VVLVTYTIEELLSEATSLATIQYEPFDQEEKLGKDWRKSHEPDILRWEEAHGHDIRLKCYPEFDCAVLEVPWAKALLQMQEDLREARNERDAAVKVLEEILFLWDSSIAKGIPFFTSTRDASSVRVVIAPYVDEYERKAHEAYEAELEKDD
jgi:hypothetical protein